MMGRTQADAAAGVGRSERTIRAWENDEPEWWEKAREEARTLWMNDMEDASRQAVIGSARLGNAEMGKWFLERIDGRLAPPKQRTENLNVDLGALNDAQLEHLANGGSIADLPR